jgi:hypothetical protein
MAAPSPKRLQKKTHRVKTEPPARSQATGSAEEIARLAYAYWEARGGHPGSAEDDWLRAERQLRIGG